MTEKPNRAALITAGLLALVFGAGFIALMVGQIRTLASAQSWKKSPAQIVGSEIFQRGARSQQWCVRFKYAYRVNGVPHVNDVFSPVLVSDAGCGGSRENALRYSELLGIGTTIRISYDPADPSVSALVTPKPAFTEYSILSMGVVFVGVAAFAFRRAR